MNRELWYATQLAAKLNSMGGIITKGDIRAIRQAFERHFREVQQKTIEMVVEEIKTASVKGEK